MFMVYLHSKLAFGLIGIVFGALPIRHGPCSNSAKSNDASAPSPEVQRIAQEVYKQIVTLPLYGVFDDIRCKPASLPLFFEAKPRVRL